MEDDENAKTLNNHLFFKVFRVRGRVVGKKSDGKLMKKRSGKPTCNEDGFLIDFR